MTWAEQEFSISRAAGTASFGWKTGGASTSAEARTFDAHFTDQPIKLDLTTTVADRIVPGSLIFRAGGKTYIDRNGTLYTDVSASTGSGTVAGSVNYTTGEVSLSNWTNGVAPGIAVDACLTTFGEFTAVEAFFRTAGSPIRPGSLYLQVSAEDGALLTATSNETGYISGDKVSGYVDQDMGVVRVTFGELVTASGHENDWWYEASAVVGGQIWKPVSVLPSTLTYSCVVLANLPLNADILGLDPVRLPTDGRVPIYRPADVVVIHNTQGFALPNPVVAGTTYNVGRTDLADLWIVDQAGKKLSADQFIFDLALGTVTMGAALDLTGLTQPLVAKHRVEDLALLSDVQINGQLTLTAPLSRDYPIDSYVSSALLFGDMNARVTNVHDLQTWSAWANTPNGAQATGEFNTIDFPIEVKNNGAVTERWRISFTDSNTFQVVGESLGVIATGTKAVDLAVTNPLTGKAYFVLRAAGWGSGWAAGNQLRFNTIGATAPIWIARTVLPGATLNGDSFSAQMRGDVDAE